MARRRRAEKRKLIPDPRYNNDLVAYMINCVMERGKKSVAAQIVYGALEDIKNQLINLSKIVKNEWDKIDKQIPDLEKEKLEFISTFPDELKELYDNLKKRGLEVIAAYRNENQCGCCGVELTSSEIEQILKTKFQQCSYCDGVVI